MSRLLALSLLVSTVLTGCGGSGDSDSGSTSTPPPAKKYTLEFVKLTLGSQSGCTVFDGLGQNFGTKYFAENAKPQRIEIHDNNGVYNQTLTAENSAVTFNVDDVPDGGYVTIIDYRPNSGLYEALSIQKELLGDYLIRLNGNEANTCYNKGKALETKSGFASILPAAGTGSNFYQFETTLKTTTKMDNVLSFDMKAYSDEKILVKGYRGNTDDLVSYGFVTELTDIEDSEPTKLTATNRNFGGSINVELTSLAISVKQGNYIYPWLDAAFDETSVTPFPYSDAESEWFYMAWGSVDGWAFNQNAAFTDDLDVSLMVEIGSAADINIDYSDDGISYVLSAPGITSDNDLVQRSYYYTKNSSGVHTSLTHTIYSQPNSEHEVIIPDLKLANLSPKEAEPAGITVSIIAAKSQDADFIESFIRRFQPANPDVGLFPMTEDSISLLLTPADQLKQRQNTKMRDYTIVDR